MQEALSQIHHDHFYDALTAMVKHPTSGILSVEHETIVRKFFFHQGHCLGVTSTDTEERPGYFLHQENHLSAEQYDRYQHQAAQPNVRQWDLATIELSWSPQQIAEAKKKHLFYVLTRLKLEKPHRVSFEPQSFPKSSSLITSAFSMLLFKSAHWFQPFAHARLPFLAQGQDATLAWHDNRHIDLLPQEAKELAALIRANPTWLEVQRQTKLSNARLQTWMLLFTSLELVRIQDSQDASTPVQTRQQDLDWSAMHMKNIQHFGQLLQQGQVKNAIDFAHQQWSKNPGQHRLSIIMIETIVKHELVQEPQYQKLAFLILEHNMQHFAAQYESFFLLGKLCYILGQPQHAIKALSRALNLRPDLGSLRDYIIHNAGNLGPRVVLESLSNHVDTMTHYSLLGVDAQASRREITLAYRQCCKHFHPDRFYRLNHQHTSDQAKHVFKKMAAAHRVLKHHQRREKYDRTLSSDTANQTDQDTPIAAAAKPFYELGILKMREKDFESAIFQFRMACQLDPNHRPIQDQLTLAMAKQQEKERV